METLNLHIGDKGSWRVLGEAFARGLARHRRVALIDPPPGNDWMGNDFSTFADALPPVDPRGLTLNFAEWRKSPSLPGRKVISFIAWETSRIPRPDLDLMRTLAEIWVPSHWQRDLFIRQGLQAERLRVQPLGYDPRRLPRPLSPPRSHHAPPTTRFASSSWANGRNARASPNSSRLSPRNFPRAEKSSCSSPPTSLSSPTTKPASSPNSHANSLPTASPTAASACSRRAPKPSSPPSTAKPTRLSCPPAPRAGARPSVSHLLRLLRHVVNKPALAAAKGRAAALAAREKWTWDHPIAKALANL
jgi:hypothetical protein